jgi:hypothetical protein
VSRIRLFLRQFPVWYLIGSVLILAGLDYPMAVAAISGNIWVVALGLAAWICWAWFGRRYHDRD